MDLAQLFERASPFVVLAILIAMLIGLVYAVVKLANKFVDLRRDEQATKLKIAEIEAEASKAAANAEAATLTYRAELELKLETFRAEDAARRDAQASTLALALAEANKQVAETNKQAVLMHSQNIEAWGVVAGAQKQTTAAVTKSEKHIITAGATATEGLSEAIGEVLQGIVKLASGQTDQTTVIESLTTAVTNLVDRLKETPGGAAVAEAIGDAVAQATPALEVGAAT